MAHELAEWDIAPTDLVHMTNTVQMVKFIAEMPQWKSFRVQHQGFDQRLYYLPASSHTKQPLTKKRKETQSEDGASPLVKALSPNVYLSISPTSMA